MRTTAIRLLAAFVVVGLLVGAGVASGPSTGPAQAGAGEDTLPLNDGGQFVFWNLPDANAADVFTTVKIAWLFNTAAVDWTSFVPALGVVNFLVSQGAVLWIVSEGAQTIVVGGGGTVDPPDDGPTDPPDDGKTEPPDDGMTDPPDDPSDGGPTDITDATFTNRDADCASYAGAYEANVTDVGRGVDFTASVEIRLDGGDCVLSSNGIPNHDFNDGGSFANPVAEVNESYTIPGSPTVAASSTALSLAFDNAIFLNGAKLDVLAAACYGVGPQPLGQEMIGCMDGPPWRYDPSFAGNDFGTDSNNAHTQPDGGYHYHGDPMAMYDMSGTVESGVIGFAADGFPIFGPYIDDGGTVRKVESGYELRGGDRVSQAGEGAFPGGSYDGTYVDDYEFTGNGDLDACNGTTRDGVYGYYVTDAYPYVIGCFTGTPDESFRKEMP